MNEVQQKLEELRRQINNLPTSARTIKYRVITRKEHAEFIYHMEPNNYKVINWN
jgi:hypothetical protein